MRDSLAAYSEVDNLNVQALVRLLTRNVDRIAAACEPRKAPSIAVAEPQTDGRQAGDAAPARTTAGAAPAKRSPRRKAGDPA